jgi:hypothetical protein
MNKYPKLYQFSLVRDEWYELVYSKEAEYQMFKFYFNKWNEEDDLDELKEKYPETFENLQKNFIKNENFIKMMEDFRDKELLPVDFVVLDFDEWK